MGIKNLTGWAFIDIIKLLDLMADILIVKPIIGPVFIMDVNVCYTVWLVCQIGLEVQR